MHRHRESRGHTHAQPQYPAAYLEESRRGGPTKTTAPRRHTEPDSHSRQQIDHSHSEPDPNALCKFMSYDKWDAGHRAKAQMEPMVEYISTDDDSDGAGPRRDRRNARYTEEPEDEDETEMVIPAEHGKHHPPDHPSTSGNRGDRPRSHGRGHPGDESADRDRPVNPKSDQGSTRQSSGEAAQDPQHEMVSKISDYVMQKTQHGHALPEKQKQMVDSLVNELMAAMRTGSWNKVPKELVRDFQQIMR